ncbi:MAG: hypothetical protein K2X99_03200 [Gemmatimonadaceae bacterium]|nr:hypothetical protein [Gemmatimonadaceae bacterium]
MRNTSTIVTAFTALVLAGSTLQAQGGTGQAGQGQRPARPQVDPAKQAERRARFDALTPEQKEAAKAAREQARTQRQQIAADVKAGKITKEQAREQLKALRDARRPAKP